MISLEKAKELNYGDIVYHNTYKNADGSPMRFKVNGQVKRWKRDPDRIRVPLKRGLWETGYLTNNDPYCQGRDFIFSIAEVNI